MNRIGIDFLSLFGMPPVQFVELAAELGCAHISTMLAPMPGNPYDFPAWSLRDDAALRRELIGALSANDISIAVGEGFMLRPGVDFRDSRADLELMREIGVHRINAISIDPDQSRVPDQFAILAELAGELDMTMVIEFAPLMAIRDLPTALAIARHTGRADVGVVIDALHLYRSDATAADVAALDPASIGYVQLCDAPLAWTPESYAEEARNERGVPGAGEFPLRDLVAAVPADVVVGLEIPQLSQAARGVHPREWLAPSVAAARQLLGDAAVRR